MSMLPRALRILRVERIVLPLSIGVVLAIAGLFYFDWDSLRNSRTEVNRLQRLLRANEALLSALKDLESGQRGYLLTGDRSYLQHYEKAKRDLPGLADELQSEVRFAEQIERVQQLRPLIQDKLTEVDATLLVRDQLGAEAALAIVRTDRGQTTMDAIRQISSTISGSAYARLTGNSIEVEDHFIKTRSAVLLGCGIIAALLALSLGLIQHANSRREDLMASLDAEKRKFQVILSSIGDGVITTDQAGVITFLNPVAAQLTGWNSQQAEGERLETVFPLANELTGETVESPARQAIREGRVVNMSRHTNLVRRDGTSTPVDDSAAPIYDSSHHLVGVVMVFRDVTARRATDLALHRWEHVFQHAGFGMAVITTGENPTLEQVNPTFAAMHGYLAGEMNGQPYSVVVAPEYWPAKAKLLHSSSQDDHSVAETIHVRKDGSMFPALVDFTAVRASDGKIVYRTEYCSDISERKRSEEELQRSEERYRVTADSIPQFIWTSRPDGTTEYLNNRWHEETGFSLEQTGEDGWSYFLDPEDRQACLDKWKQCVRSGDTFQTEARFTWTQQRRTASGCFPFATTESESRPNIIAKSSASLEDFMGRKLREPESDLPCARSW